MLLTRHDESQIISERLVDDETVFSALVAVIGMFALVNKCNFVFIIGNSNKKKMKTTSHLFFST